MTAGPIVLAAGGTGGHMFPAEALARELVARGKPVTLMTDERGQSYQDRFPGASVERIRSGRMGGGVIAKLMGLADVALGVMEARRRLRAIRPLGVVGFGGYPSVPPLMAAQRLGLPTVLHEQNALLGRANRLLAPKARRVATSFAEVVGLRDQTKISETGNPVRPSVAAMRGRPYPALGGDHPIHLLVLGGSQGARIMSEVVPGALARLPERLRARLRVSQQARPEDLEAARATYQSRGIAVELQSFFDDVPERLAEAHLVIARSGASTVAELTTVGRPAILVPYPHAADDHQTANARALDTAGAAWLVPQAAFTSEALADQLTWLLAAPPLLAKAAGAAFDLGQPEASSRLADLVLATFGASNGAPHPLEQAA